MSVEGEERLDLRTGVVDGTLLAIRGREKCACEGGEGGAVVWA